MAKVMRQLDRAGAWKVARNLLHILIDNDIPTFGVDDHAILQIKLGDPMAQLVWRWSCQR